MSESLIRRLGELPAAEPDITRTEHIRKRCHAHLARQRRRSLVSSLPSWVGERPASDWRPSGRQESRCSGSSTWPR